MSATKITAKRRREDHALLLRAFVARVVRWDRWDAERGEVACGGIRYCTRLDDDGCPALTDGLRSAITHALEHAAKESP